MSYSINKTNCYSTNAMLALCIIAWILRLALSGYEGVILCSKLGIIKFQTFWTCKDHFILWLQMQAQVRGSGGVNMSLYSGLDHSSGGSNCEWYWYLLVKRNTAAKFYLLPYSLKRKKEYFKRCFYKILKSPEMRRFWMVPENRNSRCRG